jgi:hypothetical protein
MTRGEWHSPLSLQYAAKADAYKHSGVQNNRYRKWNAALRQHFRRLGQKPGPVDLYLEFENPVRHKWAFKEFKGKKKRE